MVSVCDAPNCPVCGRRLRDRNGEVVINGLIQVTVTVDVSWMSMSGQTTIQSIIYL